MKKPEVHLLHKKYINPDYVTLIESFDFGKYFVRARDTRLYDDTGREYIDFLAGYGAHNIGHNHPRLIKALKKVMDSNTPSFLNIDAPPHAGYLGKKLNELSHPDLCRIVYASSGGEAVEIALKAAFAATGRNTLLACKQGFHGISIGASSVMDSQQYRKPFGNLLPGVSFVSFGDAAELEKIFKKIKPAAFIVEPVQAEGGVHIPPLTYLKKARKLCNSHKAILIVDEIQTGLGRCGRMFATPFAEVVPDILLLGKSLSGGMVPVSASIFHKKIYNQALGGAERSYLYKSTFSGGTLAMTAGLETLKIIEDEKLCQKAHETGSYLKEKLTALAKRHSIIKEVRGLGLLTGIEFHKPQGLLMKAVPDIIRDSLYSYVIAAVLLRDHGLIVQPCSLGGNVLRFEPPLTITKKEIDLLGKALDQTMSSISTHESALKSALKKRLFGRKL